MALVLNKTSGGADDSLKSKGALSPTNSHGGWLESIVISVLIALATFHCTRDRDAYAQGPVLQVAKRDQRFLSLIVTRVIDGDTIQGRETWPKNSPEILTIRLLGVDTPETVKPHSPVERCGPESTLYTMSLLPPGSYVWVENDGDETTIDRYGRRVAYVWKGPMLVNAAIVSRGWSAAYLSYPFKKKPLFRKLEAEARAKGMGLWSKAECQ